MRTTPNVKTMRRRTSPLGFPDRAAEAKWIAEKIAKLVRQADGKSVGAAHDSNGGERGISYSDIAIGHGSSQSCGNRSYTTLSYVYSMRVLSVPQAPIGMKEVPMPGNLSPSQIANYEWQRDYRRAYRPDLQTLRDRITEIIELCGRRRILVPLVIASILLLRDFWTFAFALASAFALLAGMIYPYFWVHYYGLFLPMVFLLSAVAPRDASTVE